MREGERDSIQILQEEGSSWREKTCARDPGESLHLRKLDLSFAVQYLDLETTKGAK